MRRRSRRIYVFVCRPSGARPVLILTHPSGFGIARLQSGLTSVCAYGARCDKPEDAGKLPDQTASPFGGILDDRYPSFRSGFQKKARA